MLTDLQVAQSRGDAVVALLERAEIAPVPAVYGLAYDYVAGEQTISARRIGHLIDSGVPPDAEDRQALYAEFARPYALSEGLERVIATMVERLEVLDALLVERQDVSRAHERSLAAVGLELEGPRISPQLMREWMARLLAATELAREANARLGDELERASDKLTEAREEMERLSRDALIDPVTGAANRAGLDAALAAAMVEARAGASGLAVAVVDVDHFKRFNDMYGHQVGDEVLRIVTRALRATVRADDVVGRMGGDEFLVILTDVQPGAAHGLAEAMRLAVIEGELGRVLGPDVVGNITASIGLAHWREADSVASLIERADLGLLEAKREGRNRVAGDRPRRGDAEAA